MEHRSEIIIHRHVEVSFSITFVIVLETMPLLWKRTDSLCEECELLGKDGELSFVGVEKFPADPYEVPEIHKFFHKFIRRKRFSVFGQFRFECSVYIDRAVLSRKEYLYLSGSIGNRRKAYFPETPVEQYTSSKSDTVSRSPDNFLNGSQCICYWCSIYNFTYLMRCREPMSKRIDSEGSHPGYFFDTGLYFVGVSRHKKNGVIMDRVASML